MEFFDSHAHYNDEKFKEDKHELLQEMLKSEITRIVTAGYSINSSLEALKIAKEHNFIYCTIRNITK